MSKQSMTVAAPRREKWDPQDPSSRIVLYHTGRLHPANPFYHTGVGEVCICEGQGVKGDPGKQETPWMVHPYPEIIALIREGRLVEVRAKDDTRELQLSQDDLHSMDLSARAIKGLTARHVESVTDLAEKVKAAPDPKGFLASVQGVGPAAADDILEQLEARGLYG